MNLLDRLFQKSEAATPLESEHGYCSRCGKPMAPGYLIGAKAYDSQSGRPIIAIHEGVMCSTWHRKKTKDAYYSDHAGVSHVNRSKARWVFAGELP